MHSYYNRTLDSEIDVVESAKILSALKVEEVKLHSLYIVKNTVLGEMYLNGEIEMIEKEKFIDYVILFFMKFRQKNYSSKINRTSSRRKQSFCNWSTSWW